MRDIKLSDVFSKTAEIITRDIADETILVPIKGKLADMERIYSLDPVSEYIWNKLDGKKKLSDIHKGILEKFDVDNQQAQQDVLEFIGELAREGLVNDVE